MFDTKFYKNRWRPLNFRGIRFFLFFFIVTSNYKNSMYPRSFLCEEAKIKQRTPLKEELREIGEEAIWESRFTSFFYIFCITHAVQKINTLKKLILKIYSIKYLCKKLDGRHGNLALSMTCYNKLESCFYFYSFYYPLF